MISVAPYLLNNTISPISRGRGTIRSPINRPSPTAMTRPFEDFVCAISGMCKPRFISASSSMRLMITLSPSGSRSSIVFRFVRGERNEVKAPFRPVSRLAEITRRNLRVLDECPGTHVRIENIERRDEIKHCRRVDAAAGPDSRKNGLPVDVVQVRRFQFTDTPVAQTKRVYAAWSCVNRFDHVISDKRCRREF